LQDIPAERGPIAQLGRGRLPASRGQRTGELLDQRMLSDFLERGPGADHQLVAVALDPAQRLDPANVEHPLGFSDTQPHPVQQLRATRDHRRLRLRQCTEGCIDVSRPGVAEILHEDAPAGPAAARTAAVICGYAEHLQMLPLIHSRTLAPSVARPSAMHAVAEISCPGVQ